MSQPNDRDHNKHPAVKDGVVDLIPPGSAFAHAHHAHTIVPMRILVGVLTVLLVFTLLTVFAARAEMWFAGTFNVVIPQWVNVFIALSIAVVKSTLVFAYFMQLRYDNPTNSLTLAYTVMVFLFFIGFTSIDLANRDSVDLVKAQHKVLGGTGLAESGGASKAAFSRTQAMARVQRWAQKAGDPKGARSEMVTAVQARMQALRDEAAKRSAEIGPEGMADLNREISAVAAALAPFASPTGEATDHQIRELEKAIQGASGRMERRASIIAGAIGAFEKDSKDAVMVYREVTRPLDKRDVHFIAAEITRLRAATPPAPLPEWLAAFEHDHLHKLEAALPHDDHAHYEWWNAPGDGNSPDRARPRSGITLPELGAAAGHGDGHGAADKPH